MEEKMATRCIRGAITVNEDTREEVLAKTECMLNEIIAQNNLSIEDISSVMFTATDDVKSVYPAVAARKIGIVDAALMCMQEMYVEGSLRMCVRAAVSVETDKAQSEMINVYLEGAKVLRPDRVKKNNSRVAVAIDGPAGSGKSTVAKLIAKDYNIIYVDTGAMYRTVGLYCIENNVDADNSAEVDKIIDRVDIGLDNSSGMQKIYLEGRNVTDEIRTPQVAAYASKVAAIPSVRAALVKLQRQIAEKSSVVMDGRDIGSNVLPDAQVKVYLDADVRERAARRCHELEEKGIAADLDKIAAEIEQRDKNDKNRECNPLTVAEDAVIIDTTAMTIDDVRLAIGDLINRVAQK
jgi:cytidylate kinase